MKILMYCVTTLEEGHEEDIVETSFFKTLADAKEFEEENHEEGIDVTSVMPVVINTDDFQEVDIEVEDTKEAL